MAHTLRYYKEIEQPNYSVRLEIYAKNSEAPAVEIGDVMQQLSLEIQGQQEDIDAPIVKTSLTMTFVDAPDLEDGKKCGNWEEFYTPDSTKWKVLLKAKNPYGAYTTIWGGYVTPDSYSEEISYRGPVTIIARDNIGHMQDFPFDMEGNSDGMVTLEELVNEAWSKIESPMKLDWRHEEDDAMYLLCDGTDAPHTYMNVSAFEDMNFFDAVEKALYSYGLVMRYTGSNRVTIMSLRDLPYQGKSSAPRAIEPTFIAHAQRELAPAARRIEESVKYDIEESVALPRIKENDFSGSRSTYRCAIEGVDLGYGKFGTLEHEAPIWPIIDTPHWSNMPSTSLAFNPKIYPIGYFSEQQGLTEDIYQPMYLAANNVDQRLILFKHLITCATFNLRIKFTDPISLNSSNKIERCSTFNLKSIKYAIFIEQGKTTYYYGKDGSWRIDYQELTEEYDATQSSYDFVKTINMGEFSGSTEITFAIIKIEYAQTSSGLNKYGLYAGIQLLAFEQPETNAVLETNNVNTKYVDSNNVILTRDPEFGPAYNTVTLPQIIKNGIFVKSGNAYLPAKRWAWSGGTPQQMAVYNHLQLLCYHSKPNNIISGDIVYADFVNMEAIYEWGGANHLLVSGSYNFLNGHIESAVLREFKFYSEMWSDVSGAETPTTEEDNRTTAESGGTSKSSTYTNKTDVYLGDGGGGGGSSTLEGLNDVVIEDLHKGHILVFDDVDGVWKNKAGGAGGSAALETDIVAGVSVGYISKSATLSVGMTFTEFVQMMFSQGVKTVPPLVSLAGVPSQPIEVGTEVTLNITSSFKDGYFANTDKGTTEAGCKPGTASFALNGLPVTMPHTFVASSAAVNVVSVSQSYEASTVKPTKGGAELSETIPAGTAGSESTFVVGYRAFWGYMTDDEAESIDSAAIRGLEYTDTIINPTQNSITLLNAEDTIPSGKDLIIAIPSSYDLSEVVNKENQNFVDGFTYKTVTVQCAGEVTALYKIYRYDNQSAWEMDIIKITIKA